MPGLSRQNTTLLKQSSDASPSKQASVTKKQSVSKQTSLTKKVSVAKQTSLKRKATFVTSEGQSSSLKLTKTSSSLSKQKSSVTSPDNSSANGSTRKAPVVKKQGSVVGRLRKRKVPFSVETEVTTPQKKKRKKKEKKPQRHLLYRNGEYLALRDDEDGFFLARCQQMVWSDTPKIRIRWLDAQKDHDGVYINSYIDHTSSECIITHTRLKKIDKNKYLLGEKQRKKIEEELDLALGKKVAKQEKKEKKTKQKKATLKKQVSTKAKKKSSKGKPSKEKKAKDKAAKEEKKKKVPLTEEEKRNVNRLLKPNNDVTLHKQDPFLYSREPVPFVSVLAQSKLVSRAVCLNDMKMLKGYISDRKKIGKVTARHSYSVHCDPIHFAIDKGNKEAVQLLVKESSLKSGKKAERVEMTRSLIASQGTGRYNYRSLGVGAIRALSVSRGSKEGNNALTKDLSQRDAHIDSYLSHALKTGASLDVINAFLNASDYNTNRSYIHDRVHMAIRHGHRKLAGKIIKEQEGNPFNPFNFLHKDVLLFDNEDLKQFRAVSVKKKPYNNAGITPIHAAAINPNVKYLSALLSVMPEYTIPDSNQRRPIHYAAACEGTGPIEFLIKRGQEPDDPDGTGLTCLMIACETNRPEIVSFLLNKAEQDSKDAANDSSNDGETQEATVSKYGRGGVNRPCIKPTSDYSSYCPLHIAAEKGHVECVRLLIKHGADVRGVTSAAKNKMTPMMLAASRGHLEVISVLYMSQAPVEQKDKLKRTALTHAVMNGQGHIVSYLLRLGANANQADTSGNTCVHYAAAYGWYFCLKLLLQAGANANSPNDWKVTPLGIAFLKGHIGLADILLADPTVDINFRDEQGMTLVAVACSSPLEGSIVDQLKYLVKDKKADCTITDVNGRSPLHHLAMNSVMSLVDEKRVKEGQKCRVKILAILLDSGCDVNLRDDDGLTPLMYAIQQADHELIESLVGKGGSISTAQDKQGKNILHLMGSKCMTYNMAAILKLVLKCVSKRDIEKMASEVDDNGLSPLITACRNYSSWNGIIHVKHAKFGFANNASDDEDEDNDDEDDDDEPMDEDNEDDEPMSEDNDDDDDEDKESDISDASEEPEPVPTTASAEVLAQWEAGRKFIKALVTSCGADIDDQHKPRQYKAGAAVPEKTEDRYVDKGVKMNAVFYMLNVTSEAADGAERHPGLAMVLSLKPDLACCNLEGRNPLHAAIILKRASVASKIIEAGSNLNQPSKNKDLDGLSEPLLLAARNGMDGIVKTLLNKKVGVASVDSSNSFTALHYAAANPSGWNNCLDIMKLLIKRGADVNAQDKHKRTPLHLAVNANTGSIDISSEVEELLITSGADLFAHDHRNRLPLHYAFAKIGRPFASSAIDPIELTSTLTGAMKFKALDSEDEFGSTPLHYAATRGASVCCMHLLQKGADLHVKDVHGNTPLACAVLYGHESCSIMLIQKGASINVDVHTPPPVEPKLNPDLTEKKDEKPRWLPSFMRTKVEKKTPPPKPLFQCVVESGWQGVIFILLDLLDAAGIHYTSTIETALKTRKYNLAMTLIRKKRENVKLSVTNELEQNLLHIVALTVRNHSDTERRVIDMLLNGGVDVSGRDVNQCSPLHYAALLRNQSLIQQLLKTKAVDVQLKDKFGRTPISALFWKGCHWEQKSLLDCVGVLHNAGASIDILCDYPGILPFSTKMPSDQLYAVETHEIPITPLILAVKQRSFAVARALIQHGASINSADGHKRSPLMYAVLANDVDMVKLLLDNNYNPSPEDLGKHQAARKRAPPKKRKHKANAFLLGMSRLQQQESDEEDDDEEGEDAAAAAAADAVDVPLEDVNLQFKAFPKKSDVNVNAVDDAGRTVVHYLVKSCSYGSYDNIHILKLLADAKAELNQLDNEGHTPLDLALANGVPLLSKALQKLMGKKKDAWKRPAMADFAVDDGLAWEGAVPDYRSDAEAFISETEAAMADDGEDTELVVEPDSQLNMDKTSEVVKDEDIGVHYDVLLSKIDVRAGAWGLYNFYKMQVVHQKGKDLYILFNRWGRIGDTGQFQRTPFPKCEDATKEFAKIFRAKTGNDWKNVKDFEVKSKKYRLVDTDRRKPAKKSREIQLDLKSSVPSKLPSEVQDALKKFTDVTTMNSCVKKLGIDHRAMPFGSIKKENLSKARALLGQIMELVRSVNKRQAKSPIEDPDAYQEELIKIADLSSEYYHLIPQPGYAYERIEPLSTEPAVQKQWEHVTALSELEIVKAMLAGAQHRIKEMNPLDYVYRCMGARLQHMSEGEEESQALLHYISQSIDIKSTSKIEGIFRVSRPGETARLARCGLENHKLLFHGSGIGNLLSILTRGLLVAPPEAPTTGWAFGKGIYTADKFMKSLPYCNTWNSLCQTKFMLVCEVALGSPNELYEFEYVEKVKANYDSTMYMGTRGPDPAQSLTMPTGVVIPMGSIVSQNPEGARPWRSEHNEFIVYNAQQVALRYVVQFK